MSEALTEFPVGSRVRVAEGADDVYYGAEVEGVVVPDDGGPSYPPEQRRVLVEAIHPHYGDPVTQWVMPKDLTLLDN